MKYIIKYGILNNNVDITDICLKKCTKNNIMHICSDDNIRPLLFGDPLVCVLKSIFIYDKDTLLHTLDNTQQAYIDIINEKIFIVNQIPDYIKETYPIKFVSEKLKDIHKNLSIEYGNFNNEYPEQTMVITYLTGNEKVLEIGANIGHVSLIIGYVLNRKGNNNFVALECNIDAANKLCHNRNRNNLQFYVEYSALSKRKLIQHGHSTIESDILVEHYNEVNIISWDELNKKYNIDFDTLILDCEGSFYTILIDMPEILTNIKKIIVENDYNDIYKKKYVDSILLKNNFRVDYVEPAVSIDACAKNYYEVWLKNT